MSLDEREQRELDRLVALYRRLPQAEPSKAIDDAILARAQAAVAAPRGLRFTRAFATAAVLVVAVGIGWSMRRDIGAPTPVTETTAPAARAPVAATPTPASVPAEADAGRREAPSAGAAAPGTASPAGAMADAEIDDKLAARDDGFVADAMREESTDSAPRALQAQAPKPVADAAPLARSRAPAKPDAAEEPETRVAEPVPSVEGAIALDIPREQAEAALPATEPSPEPFPAPAPAAERRAFAAKKAEAIEPRQQMAPPEPLQEIAPAAPPPPPAPAASAPATTGAPVAAGAAADDGATRDERKARADRQSNESSARLGGSADRDDDAADARAGAEKIDRASPRRWLSSIRGLIERDEIDRAREELARFEAAHPRARVPDDIRRRLR